MKPNIFIMRINCATQDPNMRSIQSYFSSHTVPALVPKYVVLQTMNFSKYMYCIRINHTSSNKNEYRFWIIFNEVNLSISFSEFSDSHFWVHIRLSLGQKHIKTLRNEQGDGIQTVNRVYWTLFLLELIFWNFVQRIDCWITSFTTSISFEYFFVQSPIFINSNNVEQKHYN